MTEQKNVTVKEAVQEKKQAAEDFAKEVLAKVPEDRKMEALRLIEVFAISINTDPDDKKAG